MDRETPTAALLVVGNEVLTAKVQDENGPYATRALRAAGVRLAVICTLPDHLDDIVEAVDRERRRRAWVFTSGGIGPTHDDVTVPAVARALGRPLRRDPALVDLLRAGHEKWTGSAEAPEPVLRMADVPEGTVLVGGGFPVLQVENVVMLPGVPQFFRAQLDRFLPALATAPFRLASLYLGLGEDRLAPFLDEVVRAHPEVEIGSYPRFDGADHRVKVTIESKDAARVASAREALLALLPPGAVIRSEGP
ncbi:competence/damage-inducible protein A [Anaeromyxobacter paludicola]|uniref:Molybdenum cofactor biosynthesis protein n=1 Tax=Anaeromyxobacter paludicola TaxID=2918171 RepID=A0ABN6N3A2_9BACT|nr:molybdopterin-binding protein [Anaeromyxobacter paludicola]BDG07667.1 molybdenum cofactor biosynthesis protein [Anaeromyxobacter paludicola]